MRPIFKPQPSFDPKARYMTCSEDRTPTGYICDPNGDLDTRSVDKDDPPGRPPPLSQQDTTSSRKRRRFR